MLSAPSEEALLLPQWQGYAVDDRPARGAYAIAAALREHERFHAVSVADWHALAGEPTSGEHAGDVLGLGELVDQAASALRWLDAAAPARLLTIAGDCGADFAPIAWQAARHGDDLGLLYLDAHADLNTPASSPSRRFHGMILRAALGHGAPSLLALQPRPLSPTQVILAGARDLDAAEHTFLAATPITVCPPAAFASGAVLAAVRSHRARRWHVHLDLDVLDPSDFPDVTFPTPSGPTLATVTDLLLSLVANHDIVGLTITEHVGGAPSAHRIAEALTALRRIGWR